jgi:hypothetical protein
MKHPLELHHLGVLSGASKMNYEPTICLVQTVHQSCTDTNNISKWKKWDSTWPTLAWSSIRCIQNDFWGFGIFGTNYAPILRQEPSHLGVPSGTSKMISELEVVWRKPCTYLTSTVTLSLNGPKRDSTWPMSPSSSIRCVQKDFHASSTFDENCAPILCEG